MLESGYKISDLPVIPITGENCPQKDKIAVDDTYVLGYSHTVYGIKYNRNNYRIPLVNLRDDIKGYIGIESLIKPWTISTKFWHGNWENDSSKNKSYVYVWQDSDKNNLYYSPEKFSDLENSYYIICDAPYPFETEDLHNRDNGEIIPETNTEGESYPSVNVPLAAADPYPESRKIVLKSYVDERLSGKRLVEVTPEFRIRDYDCTYVIRAKELKKAEAESSPVKVVITYPKQAEERVKHNSLVFSLLFEGEANPKGNQNGYVDYISALTNNVEWEIRDSNGEKKELIWVNKDSEHKPLIPDVTASDLYGLSKYMIFNFRTYTNEIINHDKIGIIDNVEQKIGEYTVADYSVYAICENLVFSGDSHKDLYISSDNTINIQTVDELFKTTIDITSNLSFGSSDETLLITNEPKNHFDIVSNLTFQSANESINISKITPNLINLETTPVKPTILEELPTADDSENTYILDFSNSKNKAYYTYAKDFTLNISCENLEEDETVSTVVYLNTLWNDTDTQIISTDIRWTMSQYDVSPSFKPGRLYCIKFTHVPQQALYNESIGEMPTYGGILWHYYIASYPSCKGTLKDKFTFNNGVLALSWPLKQCGESQYKTITTDFYSVHLANNEITSVTGDVPELVSAQRMFYNATNITSCTLSNLDKLQNGSGMFGNTRLTSWNISLPNLKSGDTMFWGTKITTWNINLPLLEVGRVMFYNTPLTTFTGSLPNLVDGNGMFEYCPLTSWDIELPKLISGRYMFDGTSFSIWDISLPYLEDGYGLLHNNRNMTICILDTPNMTNAQDILSFGFPTLQQPNTVLTDLTLNVPKLSQVLLNDTYNTTYSFGNLQALINVSIMPGGLAMVETFTFSSNANNLTYQSMLNVVNALPTYTDGEHIYTCPVASTTGAERLDIKNIAISKGWICKFVNADGTEYIDENTPEPSCDGSQYDTFSFNNGELRLSWPTKTCGESEHKTTSTDFYTTYLANRQIQKVTGNVDVLESAVGMFLGTYNNIGNISSCSLSNLNNLSNAEEMFRYNKLVSWDIDLLSLVNGKRMFNENKTLITFNSSLPLLSNGDGMFYNTKLTTWDIDLPQLISGQYMFFDNKFTYWDIDLPLLEDGTSFFESCQLLDTCILYAPLLSIATNMFRYTPLKSLALYIPLITDVSLAQTTGNGGFGNLIYLENVSIIEGGLASATNFAFSSNANNLTYQSMLSVANELPSYESGTHTYTCPINETTEEERANITNIVESKGWTVSFV